MLNQLMKKGLVAAAMAALAVSASAVSAQSQDATAEVYAPTIWIDPDGCEHWVMDDGFEGYMDLKVNRQGLPTCHKVQSCAVMNSDQLFSTDKYGISAGGRQRLEQFFAQAGAMAYIIIGHTDSRASDEYNMRLSYNRANAVAKIAAQTGARIADVRGYGERMPIASNGTSSGMAQNRRVEIICVK
ncbi:OmpA family protein [Celeribacter marinus]|uniref:OmpA family protein n=2 Tax=Celeribacter marinus TaxID=1397108 RepID=A0A0P0AAZ1_9RHOB|nr:OmpA family protein [Celeribacter marinus]ALI55364.1 OmpA family protein [Celeribacter marinus]